MANQSRTFSARYIAVTGILGAVAFVLMLFPKFPIPALIPSFIEFDFSDLPALVGAFAMGPVCGVLVELVKNLLKLPFTHTGAVGELSNFLLGAIFVFVAGLIYKNAKNKKGAVIGSIVGAVAMGVCSIAINHFVVYPFYYNMIPESTILEMYQVIRKSTSSVLEALVVFNMPFTICKGLADVVITFLIYKHISPLLKGSRN